MRNNIVIEFQNASKRYFIGERSIRTLHKDLERFFSRISGRNGEIKKELWALRDINLKISKGESVGIIGPNGSGKTTIFKLISNVTFPTKGKVIVNGKIGSFIDLNAGFHPELTGLENIYLNAAIRGMKRKEIKGRIDEILHFAEIEQRFRDTPIKHYSSGMKIRLGFSVAVLCPFDILLIDEVLAVGDIAFQEKCFGKLYELKKMNKTIIFVSHDLTQIEKICSRVIYLSGGGIIIDANTAQAINRFLQTVDYNL